MRSSSTAANRTAANRTAATRSAAAKSDFVRVLQERGFIHQCTDLNALDKAAAAGRVTAYVGYDCTAKSLHIGHLVSIMMLRWLQVTGHKPIVLMGGGTTKVGDPSGKDESRRLLADGQIAENMAAIKRSFTNFLGFGDAAGDAIMENNAHWLESLSYVAFLRDYGRHFSVNRMLTFDSVRLRLEREQPLSFLEFNYMILQAYDFVELARRHDCGLQMGGSDQWGNIVNGVELGRRVLRDDPGRGDREGDGGSPELIGLTCPLITTASGQKMGKTAAGAVWLSPDRLPGYDYWQFWRNTEDADVGRFLKLFTDLPLDEIARLEALRGSEINEAKKILATEATALCRGRADAEAAAETARETFEQGRPGGDLPRLSIDRAEISAGIAVFELMRRAGLTDTNGAARRLIKQGGGRLNDVQIDAETRTITDGDLSADGNLKLSAGKKRHVIVEVI